MLDCAEARHSIGRVTESEHDGQPDSDWIDEFESDVEDLDAHPLADWDDEEDPEDDEPPPAWRRPLIVGVAIVTVIALAMIPIYNVVFARSVSDSGLEVCGFDYCIVQEAVRAAGLDLTMSALANTYMDEEEARAFADELTGYLGIEPVELAVVTDLAGRLGGVYEPSTRSISIERPARAWTVLHEVAHAVQTGHGEAFQGIVVELAGWSAMSRR